MTFRSLNVVKQLRKYQKIDHLTRCMSSSSGQQPGDKTSLYDFHVANKGKMVNFAGYLLPVQYADLGITASHLHTRKHASVFDVSHMLQTYVTGKDAVECFESICTADIRGLQNGGGTLTVFTNDKGGILDDLIVTKVSDEFLYVVSNAARKEHDSGLISDTVERFKKNNKSVNVKFFDPSERALLAVQGPSAVKAVQEICYNKLDNLYFMQSVVAEIGGVADCRVTRCGYTGEDGVEISIPADKAPMIAELLLERKTTDVKLAGLGARDSLRLEAGLCLYGSDIDDTTTPIEAGLAWLVAKRRRNNADFPGASVILQQLQNGCSRRRVGIRLDQGPPARHDVLVKADGQEIGKITSGCPSPSLGYNIGMGYVKDEFKKPGTKVELEIRNKNYSAHISKMPFAPTNYYMKPK